MWLVDRSVCTLYSLGPKKVPLENVKTRAQEHHHYELRKNKIVFRLL